MSSSVDDKVEKLESRVNLLQNLAWVLGAIGVFLGIGGASLWHGLNKMRDDADALSKRVATYQDAVEKANRELNQTVASTLDSQLKAALTALAAKETASINNIGASIRRNPDIARALQVQTGLDTLKLRLNGTRLQRTHCNWAAGGGYPQRAKNIWVNGYEGPVDLKCGEGEFLAGIYSTYDKGRRDRAFDFVCCRLDLQKGESNLR